MFKQRSDKEKKNASMVLRKFLTGVLNGGCSVEHDSFVLALEIAIDALDAPNPCDNCVGPALAISRGIADMRVMKEGDYARPTRDDVPGPHTSGAKA